MNRSSAPSLERARSPWRRPLVLLAAWIACTLSVAAPLSAQTDLTVYDDALGADWQNWSWADVDLASSAEVHAGSTAIAVTADGWEALSLWHPPINTTGYGELTFWIHGGAAGLERLFVYAERDGAAQPSVAIGPVAAGAWQQVSIPLASLGIDDVANFTRFSIQEGTGAAPGTFYVDDVVITGSVPTIPPPPLSGMALYQDSYVNGWQNWSWAQVNTANTAPVNSGSSSIAVTAGAYTALSFHHAAMDTSGYQSLTFWIHGGSTGGQVLKLTALRSGSAQPGLTLPPLQPDLWQKVVVPLGDLGVAGSPDLTDIWLQEIAGVDSPTFYVDDVRLDFAPPPTQVSVTVDTRARGPRVDARMFGLNTAIWDGTFNTATTAELLNELDNQALRFPGGSISDIYDWKTNTSEGNTWEWATSFDDFANVAVLTQAQVYITVNYGTGTPEQAADWVRYSNVEKGYGFKYWEVGNENYGTWEADINDRPHDPVTYANRFKEYMRQMKEVDPSIKVGAVITGNEDSDANYADLVVTNPRTGEQHSGWTAVLLDTFRRLRVTPDFVIYHRYEQGPGGENDAFLLNSARTWDDDAAAIRQMLSDYLGRKARQVEITCTENNSVYSNPGKQTTSLVNGLFLADSIGNILQTEFKSFFWWDLRNGQEAGNNNSPFLYGWRRYGDYGIVTYADPAGPADRYPTFYVYKLLQHYARGGERVLSATSDYHGLAVYAVRGLGDHAVHLLVINKHHEAALPTTITLEGMRPGRKARVFSYGIPQDEAARTGEGSADVQSGTMTISGPTFTIAPEPYSATVIQIPWDHGRRGCE